MQQHRSCNALPCNAATSATPVPIRHRCPCGATSRAMPVPVPSPLPRWPPRSPPATPRAPSSPLRPWVPLTAHLLQRHPRALDPRVLVALGVQVSPHHLLGVLRGRERWGGSVGLRGGPGRSGGAGVSLPGRAPPWLRAASQRSARRRINARGRRPAGGAGRGDRALGSGDRAPPVSALGAGGGPTGAGPCPAGGNRWQSSGCCPQGRGIAPRSHPCPRTRDVPCVGSGSPGGCEQGLGAPWGCEPGSGSPRGRAHGLGPTALHTWGRSRVDACV